MSTPKTPQPSKSPSGDLGVKPCFDFAYWLGQLMLTGKQIHNRHYSDYERDQLITAWRQKPLTDLVQRVTIRRQIIATMQVTTSTPAVLPPLGGQGAAVPAVI